MSNDETTLLRETTEYATRFLTLCRGKGLKVVTVESMTAGKIVNSLTNVPGFSDVIYGGLVVYHEGAKREVLDVKTDIDIYSEPFAERMCVAGLSRTSATISVSVTGHANPRGPEDGSCLFHTGVAIRLGASDVKTWTKEVVLDDEVIQTLTENNTDRRRYIKRRAVNEILQFATECLRSSASASSASASSASSSASASASA